MDEFDTEFDLAGNLEEVEEIKEISDEIVQVSKKKKKI